MVYFAFVKKKFFAFDMSAILEEEMTESYHEMSSLDQGMTPSDKLENILIPSVCVGS